MGAPVRQSLSPLIHTAWIQALGLDALYAPFSCKPDRFRALVEGLRGGVVAGLNVTAPFKESALELADIRASSAESAGAANLLLFHADGSLEARNTDGVGLLAAFHDQTPDWVVQDASVLVLGAGGAARGAVAALHAAGAKVWVANRTQARAEYLATGFPGVQVVDAANLQAVLSQVGAVVNATSAGLNGVGSLDVPLEAAAPHTVIMDMVYKPLRTPFLLQAAERGLRTVDGLAMLIGQAVPSFEAIFGQPPPSIDVRTLALRALGEAV